MQRKILGCQLMVLLFIELSDKTYIDKDKNVHRFALSAIKGELLKRERKIVLGYYTRVTYYLL